MMEILIMLSRIFDKIIYINKATISLKYVQDRSKYKWNNENPIIMHSF